jgi:holo-[acyl-carrier protein] synthase
MLRCGIDLIEVTRVRSAIEKHGERFVRRIYTAEEMRYCNAHAHPWPHWAARFAAKEALYKSLPAGTLRALVWSQMGVVNEPSGAPHFEFTGHTAEALAAWQFSLSISHVRELAVAQVVAQPPPA